MEERKELYILVQLTAVLCFLGKGFHILFHFALSPANYVAGPAKMTAWQNLASL